MIRFFRRLWLNRALVRTSLRLASYRDLAQRMENMDGNVYYDADLNVLLGWIEELEGRRIDLVTQLAALSP